MSINDLLFYLMREEEEIEEDYDDNGEEFDDEDDIDYDEEFEDEELEED